MLLEVKNLSKTFPGVVALNNVSVGFLKGEIHALVGENGAGKSTLIKIIGGKYHSDSGRILFKGKELKITDPHKALEMGISIVYQEYNLIPNLKVVENILLGHEPIGKIRKIDWKIAREFSLDLMNRLNVSIDLDKYVSELGAAEAKIVEILKALAANAEIVIMDEPTAALPEREVESLFGLIRSLKDSGVTVIYISHRIDEIFSIADRVTVLKDGKLGLVFDHPRSAAGRRRHDHRGVLRSGQRQRLCWPATATPTDTEHRGQSQPSSADPLAIGGSSGRWRNRSGAG